jgi:NADH-quinone oxidoreductase subunit K
VHIVYPAVVSALLFAIGVYGVLARRNTILVLMSVELMLNAVNLNLVAFDVWLADRLHSGQVLTLFVIVIAAAEVGLGLAIVLALYRNRRTVDIDQLRALAEPVNDLPATVPASAAPEATAGMPAATPQRGRTPEPRVAAEPQLAAQPQPAADPHVASERGTPLKPEVPSRPGLPHSGAPSPDEGEDQPGGTPESGQHRPAEADAEGGRGDEHPVKRGGRL